jgi:hypothetical protein
VRSSPGSKDGPKRRDRHYSYDESVDEPAKLIEDEQAEIEQEGPAEENEPVEGIGDSDKPDTPAFKD